MGYQTDKNIVKSYEAIISSNGIVAFFDSTKLDKACRPLLLDKIRGPPSSDFQFKYENSEERTCQGKKDILFT